MLVRAEMFNSTSYFALPLNVITGFETRVCINETDVVVMIRPGRRRLRRLAAYCLSFPHQNVHHLGAVVIPSQEIQNGINAAVDARQRPGDLVGKVYNVEEFTVKIQHAGRVVEGPCDVKWDEAHSEHHQHQDDELDGFLT